MPAWLTSVPGRIWGWLAGGAAVAGAILAGLAQAKRDGAAAQVAAQAKADMEAARVRIEAENDAARIADPNAELHQSWRR